MENELRYYITSASQSKKRCRVLPTGNPEKLKDDMVQIRFTFNKVSTIREVAGVDYPTKISCPQPFGAGKLVPMISREKLLKHREAYAKRFGAAILSALFGIPESEHGSITDAMFEVVETAVPLRRIRVSILELSQQVRRVTSTSSATSLVVPADATIDDGAASTSTDDIGAPESTHSIDDVKVERPKRSAKNPGYLKDYCFRNKVGHCSFYC